MSEHEKFEFDPLPGDATPPKPGPAVPPPTKKNGAAKPGRKKKRGPRRVQPAEEITSITVTNPGPGASPVAPIIKTRKKREPKADLGPEFAFIKQLMELTEPTRKRVLAVLNKVFS